MSRHQERQVLTIFVVAVAAVIGLVAILGGGGSGSTAAVVPSTSSSLPVSDTAAPVVTDPPAADVTDDSAAPVAEVAASDDLDGEDLESSDECLMSEFSLRQGQSGDSVTCLQEALVDAGFLDAGSITGEFDYATFVAVEDLQTERKLFVDGVVGRETAISLGIWPDEESFVVRTPPPPPGAMDSMGFPLSSVSSTGDDAPPLPPNSGSGRRVVYERAGQRVWAVDENENIIRSWLVSGSQYANEMPGTHQVYSRSEMSTAWNGKAWLPKMIRYQQTRIGAIGFHAIPLHVEDNSPYQTEAELGKRLSGGCQRQANADAAFLWEFAPVGTTVVVI